MSRFTSVLPSPSGGAPLHLDLLNRRPGRAGQAVELVDVFLLEGVEGEDRHRLSFAPDPALVQRRDVVSGSQVLWFQSARGDRGRARDAGGR